MKKSAEKLLKNWNFIIWRVESIVEKGEDAVEES